MSGRTGHPRSRVERRILRQLEHCLERSLRICELETGLDALSSSSAACLSSPMEVAIPRFSSAPMAKLFHKASAEASSCEERRRRNLRHYTPEQLSEHARAVLLSRTGDYSIPLHGNESAYVSICARKRFDAIISAIQQRQLVSVRSDLSSWQPNGASIRPEDRFHLSPANEGGKPLELNEWTQSISAHGGPEKLGMRLEIVPTFRAVRYPRDAFK
jgi:hypothetical protein